MGAVYEVEHAVTGERLALKVLWLGANATPEALARFKREVQASARIKSENVVRVTDADAAPELGGAPFLVMELLEGTDLERAATAAPPAPATVVDWLRQVARAVDKAHHLGIVHRDLKPENLFLVTSADGPPLVKVLDFGIVKMLDEGTGATVTGQILGTPKYMAPEQASANAPVTPATDRCALGLIAYRLLIGESYHQGGVMSVLGQLLHGQLEPPSQRGSRFGAPFDGWFLKACDRDPERRFASASEQIEALSEALGLPRGSVEVTPPPPSARSSMSPPANKTARRALLAGAFLVAATVVAIGAWRVPRTNTIGGQICGMPNLETSAACGPCLAQACCKQAQDCAEVEGCAKLETCVRACASGDAVCRATCYAGEAAIAPLQQAVETCRAVTCGKECLVSPWACLGHVKWASARKPPRITIKAMAICTHCGAGGQPFAEGPGGSPVAGATVRVCSLADPKCGLPLAAGTTDDHGGVTLELDTSLYNPPLSIFLELRKDGFEDTLLNLSTPPLSVDLDVGRVVLLDLKTNQEPTASQFGTTYDSTRATADVHVSDCDGRPAAKETALTWLDRDEKTVTRPYFAYTGGAIAINLPVSAAGLTRIVARVAATDRLVAVASVVVRPKANTEVRLAPAP